MSRTTNIDAVLKHGYRKTTRSETCNYQYAVPASHGAPVINANMLSPGRFTIAHEQFALAPQANVNL